jgi:DNA polymerase elongation subunit (family B)
MKELLSASAINGSQMMMFSSLTWDKKQSDKAMIKAFLKVMAQADEIVAHNGDKFDLKWLRTRALLHGS